MPMPSRDRRQSRQPRQSVARDHRLQQSGIERLERKHLRHRAGQHQAMRRPLFRARRVDTGKQGFPAQVRVTVVAAGQQPIGMRLGPFHHGFRQRCGRGKPAPRVEQHAPHDLKFVHDRPTSPRGVDARTPPACGSISLLIGEVRLRPSGPAAASWDAYEMGWTSRALAPRYITWSSNGFLRLPHIAAAQRLPQSRFTCN